MPRRLRIFSRSAYGSSCNGKTHSPLNKLNKEIVPSNIYLILYIIIEITITITIFELGAGLYKSQQIFIHPYQHMTLMSYVLHHMS
jgi:hypothetical protein